MSFQAHSLSPSELAQVIAAERRGSPFLAYREAQGALVLCRLDRRRSLLIGRLESNDVVLDWDPEVSRVHARLERHGELWTLIDDGLSRNGTFVSGERVAGRHRLAEGDTIELGHTSLRFRSPGAQTVETVAAADTGALVSLTEADRRVLAALCRPVAASDFAAPASNKQIAQELSLSVEGVKARIRGLFAKLEVGALPQNQKRAELARRALAAGLIARRDLDR